MMQDVGPSIDRHRLCPRCDAEAVPNASHCVECGLSLLKQSGEMDSRAISESASTSTMRRLPSQQQLESRRPVVMLGPPSDADILANLRGYKKHRQIKCLHCGYQGLMGVVQEQQPQWAKWWILTILILTGVGIVVVICLALISAQNTVYEVQCPSCKRHLVYPAGAKLRRTK